MPKVTLTYLRKKWVFPSTKFVQYDDHDEIWCRPLGIGHEVTVLEDEVIECAAIFPRPDGVIELVSAHLPTY